MWADGKEKAGKGCEIFDKSSSEGGVDLLGDMITRQHEINS
jgi:hypothetical protein